MDIVGKYDSDRELLRSDAYGDGGTDFLFSRLEGAVMNQCEEDIVAFPRYAIWANTVRDHIGSALVKLEDGETDEAKRLLIHAHNSLAPLQRSRSLLIRPWIGVT